MQPVVALLTILVSDGYVGVGRVEADVTLTIYDITPYEETPEWEYKKTCKPDNEEDQVLNPALVTSIKSLKTSEGMHATVAVLELELDGADGRVKIPVENYLLYLDGEEGEKEDEKTVKYHVNSILYNKISEKYSGSPSVAEKVYPCNKVTAILPDYNLRGYTR